jgi:hypothetical protein
MRRLWPLAFACLGCGAPEALPPPLTPPVTPPSVAASPPTPESSPLNTTVSPSGLTVLPVKIQTAGELESRTHEALETVLRKHDVGRYVFSEDVVIDHSVNPHSHPVITLHTRYADDPDRLLLLFVHEQLHWFLSRPELEAGLTAAKSDLRTRYPDHPTQLPEGGFNADSTRLHLVLCWLELQAGRELLGDERARQIFAEPHIYSWVYEKVLQDEPEIGEIVRRYALVVP